MPCTLDWTRADSRAGGNAAAEHGGGGGAVAVTGYRAAGDARRQGARSCRPGAGARDAPHRAPGVPSTRHPVSQAYVQLPYPYPWNTNAPL